MGNIFFCNGVYDLRRSIRISGVEGNLDKIRRADTLGRKLAFERFHGIARGASFRLRFTPAEQPGYHAATLAGRKFRVLSKAELLDHRASDTLRLYDYDLTFHDRCHRRSVQSGRLRVYEELRLGGERRYRGDEVKYSNAK